MSSVGFSFVATAGTATRPDQVRACLDAIESKTWNKPVRYLLSQVVPGKHYPRRPGSISLEERSAIVTALLQHLDVWQVTLATSARNEPEYGSISIGTRPRISRDVVTIHGQRTLSGEASEVQDEWVGAMLRFAGQVNVTHGVVPVMEDDAVASEGSFTGFRYEGVLLHPFPEEFERMRNVEGELGKRYVRFPRWGTLYSSEHLDVLGGLDRIRKEVAPAVVRELGGGVYLQLTDSVATALSAESAEKQRAFTKLAEPLLPPPL